MKKIKWYLGLFFLVFVSSALAAAISTYPTKTTPVSADKFLISDSADSWKTKNVTFDSLVIAGNSGYTFTLGSLSDLKITLSSTATSNLVDDSISYGATDDNLRVYSIEKVGALLALKSTIVASGTTALGTSAISSGECAPVVTTTATGTATTDVINWGFNADPTSTTGYTATANGMLTIISYPSSNNVNFKVCNNTASSITPGAITLNWRVLR